MIRTGSVSVNLINIYSPLPTHWWLRYEFVSPVTFLVTRCEPLLPHTHKVTLWRGVKIYKPKINFLMCPPRWPSWWEQAAGIWQWYRNHPTLLPYLYLIPHTHYLSSQISIDTHMTPPPPQFLRVNYIIYLISYLVIESFSEGGGGGG